MGRSARPVRASLWVHGDRHDPARVGEMDTRIPRFDPWTVGIEEEVMLLEPDGSPAWRSEDVLQALPPELLRARPR